VRATGKKRKERKIISDTFFNFFSSVCQQACGWWMERSWMSDRYYLLFSSRLSKSWPPAAHVSNRSSRSKSSTPRLSTPSWPSLASALPTSLASEVTETVCSIAFLSTCVENLTMTFMSVGELSNNSNPWSKATPISPLFRTLWVLSNRQVVVLA